MAYLSPVSLLRAHRYVLFGDFDYSQTILQVKRGLTLWRDGNKPILSASANAEGDDKPATKRRSKPDTAFGDVPWGAEAAAYFAELQELLDERRWEGIFDGLTSYSVKTKAGAVKVEDNDGGGTHGISEPKVRRLRV